jgi:hypothetical protein
MKGQFRAQAAWLDRQLAEGKSWVGGDTPSLADIAWYMNFWFLRSALKPQMIALLEGLPQVSAWRERVAALGHGQRSDITTADAIAEALAAEPASAAHIVHDAADPMGVAPGTRVYVTADDYGRDPIEGALVAANAERIVIAREHPRVGQVNVHFPRVGFFATPA